MDPRRPVAVDLRLDVRRDPILGVGARAADAADAVELLPLTATAPAATVASIVCVEVAVSVRAPVAWMLAFLTAASTTAPVRSTPPKRASTAVSE